MCCGGGLLVARPPSGIAGLADLPAYALGVIILTNAVTSLGVFVGTKMRSRRASLEAGAADASLVAPTPHR